MTFWFCGQSNTGVAKTQFQHLGKKSDVRPILIQSDLSVENRRFLRVSTEAIRHDVFDWICQSKKSVENVLLYPSHRPSHHKTRTHKSTHAYQIPHGSVILQRRRGLGCHHCCCFSPQVGVAHSSLRPPYDGSSGWYRCHFANNSNASCSFGGSRLSATPRM